MKRNFKVEIKQATVFSLAALALGCAGTARAKAKVDLLLQEESRALTSAVVETLQLQPAIQKSEFTSLALNLAQQDQRLEGFPLAPFPVTDLLGTNSSAKGIAERETATRFETQNQLLARQRKFDQELIQRGAMAEESSARRARFWAKWVSAGTMVTGGIVALCVFFPVAIPVAGRMLAWVVGKLPSLAGAVGVVGVKAFDAIVRGIEKSRAASENRPAQTRENFSNDESGQSGSPAPGGGWLERLESNLSKTMDSDHKRLVKIRKTAVA